MSDFSKDLIDLIDQPLCVLDKELNILLANTSFCKISGYTLKPDAPVNILDYASSKLSNSLPANIIRSLNETGKWFGVIHSNHPDNSYGLAVTIESLKSRSKTSKQTYLCKVQATSEQQGSNPENEYKKLFELIFNNTQNIVFILQEAESGLYSKIFEANNRAADALGMDANSLFHTNFIDLLTDRSRSAYLISSDELTDEKPLNIELTLITKPGPELHLEGMMSRVFYEQKKTILLVARNLTKQREFENKLSQIEKLEAVGQLAGGIAHDFNNVLAGISGLAELSLRKMAPDHPAAAAVKTIHQKANNTANMVKQLVAFSRKQSLNVRETDINKTIRNNQKLLERYLGEDITFILNLAKAPGIIKADQTALDQIITNLCINARDAMPDGGELTIRTRQVQIDRERITPSGRMMPGKYVMLSIHDTGIGISGEVQKHIFEPFYTTKDIGYGTGLGLSIVYGLIKQHKGFIECKSDIGEGTCFDIYFPWHGTRITPQSPKPDLGRLTGNETILIVEDEADLILFLKESLEFFGYKTVLAHNGSKALEIYEIKQDEIDLIVSDVVMPEMGGVELKLIVEKMNAEQKFVLISAYTNRIEPGVPFLQKPFQAEELAWTVRQILDNTYKFDN